jgi:NADH-quinone oxidoreductase subunit N
MPSSLDIAALLPFLLLVLGALVLMLSEVFLTSGGRGYQSGLAIAFGLAAAAAVPFAPQRVLFGGQAVSDGFSGFVAVVVCAGLVLSALLGRGWLSVRNMERGEYYALALFGASGMVLLGMATDLLLAFIAIEVMSLAVYSMAAYPRRGQRAPEAAFKYFILGSFASAILLYGSALFYGATGSTLLSSMQGSGGSLLAAGLSLVLVGLAFKVAAVPFHAWTPDVYEGAPTPATAFMAAGVKAAAFAFLTRGVLAMVARTPYAVGSELGSVLGFLAVLTMVVGNLFALPQRNVKRMLAYSSIAHAGYLLVGVVATTSPAARAQGLTAVLVYLAAYAFTVVGAFSVLAVLERREPDPDASPGDAWDISRFAGLASRRPWLAFAMAIFMLSLAGVPPTAGFVAKLSIFQSAAAANAWGLAVVGVLTSILGVYYYLRVVVAMYMRPAEVEEPSAAPATVVVAIAVTALVVVAVGFSPEPLAAWARAAILGM